MKEYDLIVLGSGAGMNLTANARQKNMRVALVEEDLLGGTCLNRGCIPSKILIHPADVVREIEHAKRLGVHATIDSIDFQHIRKRMLDLVIEDRKGMERGVAADNGLDLYPATGHFTGPKIIQAGKETITAPKIFVATGARPIIPPIPGLEEAGFLTSKTVFDINQLPSSLIIIGGGYIGCEFAHFFSSMGTRVVLLGQNPLLLSREEPEISHLLKRVMSENVDVRTNQDVIGFREKGGKKVAVHRDRVTGKEKEATGEEILVAAGIMGNGDVLEAKKAGMRVDSGGYIAVNEYLETGVPGIWAFGDAIGKHMFRHTANYESQIVWNNAFREKKRKVDYHAVPHAVFTYPQVAGVGLTQKQAKDAGMKILVGTGSYGDCAKGYAMAAEDISFLKLIVDAQTMKLLGASIAGPHAALMIQPLVYLMNAGDGSFYPIANSQIIHPALSECIIGTLNRLHDPDHNHQHVHKHGNEKHQQEEHGHEHSH